MTATCVEARECWACGAPMTTKTAVAASLTKVRSCRFCRVSLVCTEISDDRTNFASGADRP
jgi:hypothetical protein